MKELERLANRAAALSAGCLQASVRLLVLARSILADLEQVNDVSKTKSIGVPNGGSDELFETNEADRPAPG